MKFGTLTEVLKAGKFSDEYIIWVDYMDLIFHGRIYELKIWLGQHHEYKFYDVMSVYPTEFYPEPGECYGAIEIVISKGELL